MYNFLIVVFAVIIIFLIGYLLLNAIFNNKITCLIELFAVSFGLGAGLISIELFVVSWIGVRLNFFAVFLLVVINIFLLFLVARNRIKLGPLRSLTCNFNVVEIILISVIVISVVSTFLDALSLPICNCDAVATWSLKAKILYHETVRETNYFFEQSKSFSHPDYPLLVPFIQVYIYALLGYVDDRLVKIIFPVFFVCLLASVYSIQRVYYSRMHSLVFTAVLASLPPLLTEAVSGYADVPLSFFYFLMAGYLYLWVKDGKLTYLILSALFTGCAIFTKSEGLGLYLINLIVLVIFTISKFKKETITQLFIYIGLTITTIFCWFIFQTKGLVTQENYFSQLTLENIIKNIDRVPIILQAFVKEFVNLKRWNIVWIALLLSTILSFSNVFKKPIVYLILLFVLHPVMYLIVYIITPWQILPLLDCTLTRNLIHITPLAVYLISEEIGYILKRHYA